MTDSSATFDINLTAVDGVFHRTPLVAVGEYRCPVEHPQFAGGGPQKCPFVIFSRSSVRLLPSRGAPQVCTPNNVNVYDVGDSYARLPVSREGAIWDWLAIEPSLLREIAADVSPRPERTRHVFGRIVAPLSSKAFLAQRAFFTQVRNDQVFSELEAEEQTIRIVRRIVVETTRFSTLLQTRKAETNRVASLRRSELVEEIKGTLAREYARKLSLSDLAQRVHCSPGYLSRSFSRVSGFTLHAFQQQLRLRAALQLLADSRFDGVGIALRLGFANHSHFSSVFRSRFGITPSQFANSVTSASLRAMQAMLLRAN